MNSNGIVNVIWGSLLALFLAMGFEGCVPNSQSDIQFPLLPQNGFECKGKGMITIPTGPFGAQSITGDCGEGFSFKKNP